MTNLEKAKVIGTVFKGGVKKQIQQQWTWGAAVSVANGVYNVVSLWSDTKTKVFNEGV